VQLATTAIVQVFGRRHDGTIHGLKRPASEKRQGTKSRWVGHPRVPRALWGFGWVEGAAGIGWQRSGWWLQVNEIAWLRLCRGELSVARVDWGWGWGRIWRDDASGSAAGLERAGMEGRDAMADR